MASRWGCAAFDYRFSGRVGPISGEDGFATIVFNGETDNFLELKYQLDIRGYVFKEHSDIEIYTFALLYLMGRPFLDTFIRGHAAGCRPKPL